MQAALAADAASVPQWLLGWVLALAFHSSIVQQMLALAAAMPASGVAMADGLFRSTTSYLTLYWQAHAANTAKSLGSGLKVWSWLESSDYANGVPG